MKIRTYYLFFLLCAGLLLPSFAAYAQDDGDGNKPKTAKKFDFKADRKILKTTPMLAKDLDRFHKKAIQDDLRTKKLHGFFEQKGLRMKGTYFGLKQKMEAKDESGKDGSVDVELVVSDYEGAAGPGALVNCVLKDKDGKEIARYDGTIEGKDPNKTTEYAFGAEGDIKLQHSWFTAFVSGIRQRCHATCVSSMNSCMPQNINNFSGLFNCLNNMSSCISCMPAALACATCNCGWTCSWACGCCNQSDASSGGGTTPTPAGSSSGGQQKK